LKTISREELEAKLDREDEFILLEVLGEASYRREHLPGAIRYGDMEQLLEILPGKNTEVIAYCSNFN
jgi:rhodanese-related sulfurtransferase